MGDFANIAISGISLLRKNKKQRTRKLIAYLNATLRELVHIFAGFLGPQRPDEARIAYQALKKTGTKGVMIDVGAHFGGSLRPFALHGWRVFAFEPDSDNRAQLQKRFGQFQHVVIDPRAVSDTPVESATLYRSPESTGISTLTSFEPSHAPAETVGVTTLEIFLTQNNLLSPPVDFLKIDTEGFDVNVLRGYPWKDAHPRLILCEFEDSKEITGYTFLNMAAYLQEQGYQLVVSEWYPIRKYGESHRWRGFAKFPCELADPKGWGNIFATNDSSIYDALWHICAKKNPQG